MVAVRLYFFSRYFCVTLTKASFPGAPLASPVSYKDEDNGEHLKKLSGNPRFVFMHFVVFIFGFRVNFAKEKGYARFFVSF